MFYCCINYWSASPLSVGWRVLHTDALLMRETTHPHHFTDNKLTTGQRTVMDINSELIKLQTSHKNAIQGRDDAKKELASERNHQKQQKWEMENLVRREKDFKEQLDKVHMEIVALRSHMPVLGENCILPSPIFSFCYNCQATNNKKKNHVFSLFFWQRRAAGAVYRDGFLWTQCVTIYLFQTPLCVRHGGKREGSARNIKVTWQWSTISKNM